MIHPVSPREKVLESQDSNPGLQPSLAWQEHGGITLLPGAEGSSKIVPLVQGIQKSVLVFSCGPVGFSLSSCSRRQLLP